MLSEGCERSACLFACNNSMSPSDWMLLLLLLLLLFLLHSNLTVPSGCGTWWRTIPRPAAPQGSPVTTWQSASWSSGTSELLTEVSRRMPPPAARVVLSVQGLFKALRLRAQPVQHACRRCRSGCRGLMRLALAVSSVLWASNGTPRWPHGHARGELPAALCNAGIGVFVGVCWGGACLPVCLRWFTSLCTSRGAVHVSVQVVLPCAWLVCTVVCAGSVGRQDWRRTVNPSTACASCPAEGLLVCLACGGDWSACFLEDHFLVCCR